MERALKSLWGGGTLNLDRGTLNLDEGTLTLDGETRSSASLIPTTYGLLIMVATVFCLIFVDGPVLVYLKSTTHLTQFYAKLHFLLFNVTKDLPTV